LIIFLDSNILFREYGQPTFHFKALIRYISANGHQIIIPEVVYRETERLYHERIDGYNQDINRLFNEQRFSMLATSHPEIMLLDKSQMISDFWQGLFQRPMPHPSGIRLEPYRSEHQALAIKRVLANRMPMKTPDRDGKTPGSVNARDELVWLSILDVVRDTTQSGQEYVLITNDGDFRVKRHKGPGPAPLHQDLIEDLQQLGLNANQFSDFPTLGHFLASVGNELDVLESEILELEIKRRDIYSLLEPRSRLEEERMQLLWRRRGYKMEPWLRETEEEMRRWSEIRDGIEAGIAAELPRIEAELQNVMDEIARVQPTLDEIDEQLALKLREFEQHVAASTESRQ